MKKILPFILLSALLLSSCSADEGISFSEFAKNEIKKEGTSFYTVIKNEETGEEFFELKKQEIPVSSIIKKEYSDRLSALSEFEYSSLSEDEKLLYDILKREYALKKSGSDYILYDDILSSENGVHISLVNSLCDFEIKDINDAKKYLSLYEDVKEYTDSVIAYEKKRLEAGIVSHINDYEMIVSDCISIAESPERIMSAFEKKLKNIGITETEKKDLISEHNRLTKEVFVPAYKKLAREIKKLPTRTTGGLSSLPSGKEYYAYRISSFYGKEINPDEIIKNLDNDLYYYEGIFLSTASSFPETFYEDNFGITIPYSSVEEILPDYIKKAEKNFPDLEKFVPEAEYTSILKLPVMADERKPTKVKISTVYPINETMDYISVGFFPGGAYRDFVYESYLSDTSRKSFKNESFADGWDMYAQYEMNTLIYGNTPSQELMNSNYIFWVMIIARVDMGVNYEGWGETEVDNFFREHNLSVPLAEYYYNLAVQKPFSSMKEYLCFHEITSAKENLKSTYGRNFDEITFNRCVLKNGYLPLDIMNERIISDYKKSVSENTEQE